MVRSQIATFSFGFGGSFRHGRPLEKVDAFAFGDWFGRQYRWMRRLDFMTALADTTIVSGRSRNAYIIVGTIVIVIIVVVVVVVEAIVLGVCGRFTTSK